MDSLLVPCVVVDLLPNHPNLGCFTLFWGAYTMLVVLMPVNENFSDTLGGLPSEIPPIGVNPHALLVRVLVKPSGMKQLNPLYGAASGLVRCWLV